MAINFLKSFVSDHIVKEQKEPKVLLDFLSNSKSVEFVFDHLFRLHCANVDRLNSLDANENACQEETSNLDKRRLSSIVESLEIVICTTEKQHGELSKKFRQLRQKCRTADTVEIFDVSTFLLACLKWSYIVENTHPFRHWLDSQPKCLNDFLTGQRRLETNRQFQDASTFEVLRLVGNKPDQWAKEGLDAFEEVDTVWKKFIKCIFGEFKVLNRIIKGETVPLILFQDEHCVKLNGPRRNVYYEEEENTKKWTKYEKTRSNSHSSS